MDIEEAKEMQRAINSLIAWQFEGSVGRAMMAAIDEGYCVLGREPTKDYYGNRIPSRFEVKEGTKGHRSFVEAHMGGDWAAEMEKV